MKTEPGVHVSQGFLDWVSDQSGAPDGIECHCACPNFGKWPPEGAWQLEATPCGHKFFACGLCVTEGRIKDCRICKAAKRLN